MDHTAFVLYRSHKVSTRNNTTTASHSVDHRLSLSTMSQAQVQRRTDEAKEKSQAFAVTIYQSSLAVTDAVISITYYLAGTAYGIFSGLIGAAQNKGVQADIKEAVNGAKQDLLDGAYDLKARVGHSTHSAVKEAQPKVDEAKSTVQAKASQAQDKAADLKSQAGSKADQAQGKAADVQNQAENKAGQAQDKAADVKNQAVHQGKQAQGQVKQTAHANGIRA